MQCIHSNVVSQCFFSIGELLLCEASTVYKYMQEDGANRGTYGKLVCTNFKISFLDDDSASDDNVRKQVL